MAEGQEDPKKGGDSVEKGVGGGGVAVSLCIFLAALLQM